MASMIFSACDNEIMDTDISLAMDWSAQLYTPVPNHKSGLRAGGMQNEECMT
jgi:hypothetical protein